MVRRDAAEISVGVIPQLHEETRRLGRDGKIRLELPLRFFLAHAGCRLVL